MPTSDMRGSTVLNFLSSPLKTAFISETGCGEKSANNSLTKTGPPGESEAQGIKKRRRSHKRSEESVKRIKLTHRSPRHSNSKFYNSIIWSYL